MDVIFCILLIAFCLGNYFYDPRLLGLRTVTETSVNCYIDDVAGVIEFCTVKVFIGTWSRPKANYQINCCIH